MNGITFTKQQGGLERPLPGESHISGLIVYGESAVSKRLLLSVEDLETNGLLHSTHPVLHYHVSEFFRIQPGAQLYLESVAASDGTYTEVKTLQSFAEGKIRGFAVCDYKSAISNATTRLAALNAIGEDFFAAKTPASIFLSMKVDPADMATLPDLHTMNAPFVSVVLGQDGAGYGNYLNASSASLSNIGAVLGAFSKASIHESIAWVEKQNVVSTAYPKAYTNSQENDLELNTLAFCDGSLLGDYTQAQIQSLFDKGYIFCIKHTGIGGSYINDSFTATALSSDYAYQENNAVIGEVVRELQVTLIPRISGPIYIDPETGQLDEVNASVLEGFCDTVLDAFQNAGSISGGTVRIPAGQQVLRSSRLEVRLTLVPVGALRTIDVNLSYALQV